MKLRKVMALTLAGAMASSNSYSLRRRSRRDDCGSSRS